MKIDPYKIRLTVAGIVLLLSILVVFGLFYPIKFMDIQFTPLLQRTVCDFSILAVCLSSGILLFTLLFGRFYCSIICPFGILQEFIALLRGKRKNTIHGNFGFKYLIAGLTFGTLVGGSALFIRYIEPYTIFGSIFSLTIFGIIVAILVLVLVFFKNRFFCTNICPVGAILGLIAKNVVFAENETGVTDDLISKILLYIHGNYTDNISLSSIAPRFGYNGSYISQLFKSCFNIGIARYINTLRLKNAVSLMQQRKYSTTYCAIESGFSSLRTFYRVFSSEFGCSPKVYLKQEKLHG